MNTIGGRREVEGGMTWGDFYAKQYNSKSFLVRFL
jgi:hypothetical protein